jgi:hypothetical protein
VRLKGRARKIGIPVIYVNDNFGDWRSETEVLMGRCLEATAGARLKCSTALKLPDLIRTAQI